MPTYPLPNVKNSVVGTRSIKKSKVRLIEFEPEFLNHLVVGPVAKEL